MAITSEQTLRYNAKDCFITYECAEEYMNELDISSFKDMPNFRETYDHTIELFGPCMYMMSRGIKVNRETLSLESKRVGEEMDKLAIEIDAICGRHLNPNSPKDMQTYFYIEKSIPPYMKKNSNGDSVPTCDDKALQRIARGTASRRGLREATLIQRWKKLSKLKGTYLDMTFDSDDRLRCNYAPRGTKFARLASSKTIFNTGMNMQNLDPAFLRFLEADEGCILIDIDKAQAEWVVVAYASGDISMINCIESGSDPHAYTAHNMFNVPEEIIQKENKLVGHHNDPGLIKRIREDMPEMQPYLDSWLPRTMSIRQCGKKSNHGLNYDESFRGFGLINEITDKEAKTIVDFYHSTYPGIRQYYETTKTNLLEHGRILLNLFGRPYRFLGAIDHNLLRAAYSYIPQSTVGELVNRAMCDIYYDDTPSMEGFELVRCVHDNITLQVPLDAINLGDGIVKAADYMNPTLKAGAREFEIGSDMKIGFNLSDMVEVPLVSDGDQQAKLIREAADGLQRGG